MARARGISWVWIVFVVVIGALLIAAGTVVTVKLTAPAPPAEVSINAPATLLVGRQRATIDPDSGSGELRTRNQPDRHGRQWQPPLSSGRSDPWPKP